MTVKVITGDCVKIMQAMEADSVHCVVTSPPYWNLRDYGVKGQTGLEPTLDEHVEVMTTVFREVRRVLRSNGTLWLNYGDCYAGSGASNHHNSRISGSAGGVPQDTGSRGSGNVAGLKSKDLCMIPARIAMALQADGWWLRSEIIWAKPNPMPESVRDRPTASHEKMFLLTKSARYFYDAEAVKTPAAQPPRRDATSTRPRKTDKQRGHSRRHDGFNDRWDGMSKDEQQSMGANLRNVWRIATHPYREAHFAVFPPALVEPCIKAGCPKDGIVLDPFAGSGTVGLVANRLGRDAILIELNPKYSVMARKRIRKDKALLAKAKDA